MLTNGQVDVMIGDEQVARDDQKEYRLVETSKIVGLKARRLCTCAGVPPGPYCGH